MLIKKNLLAVSLLSPVPELALAWGSRNALGKFWIHTQPEMSLGAVEGRINFFRSQQAPAMTDEVRYLAEGH